MKKLNEIVEGFDKNYKPRLNKVAEDFKGNYGPQLSKIVNDIKNYRPTRKQLKWFVVAAAATTIVTYVAWPKSKNYEQGEILLKLKNNAAITQVQDLNKGILGVPSVDALNKKYNVAWAEKVFDTIPNGDASRVYQLELPHDSDIEKIVKAYEADGNVEYAEPDFKIELEKSWFSWGKKKIKGIIPNDPGFSKQWGLTKISAPLAWEKQKGSQDIVIAIIDTGVDYNHEDLKDKILRDKDGNIIGWNFVKKNNDPMDGNNHGTHCAAIAAASTNNGKGIAGVAWNCKIMPVKGLSDYGSGYSEDLADCIVWAREHGAQVLSNSWGSAYKSNTIYEAIKYAHNKGAVIIAAAGNSNTDSPHYPSAHLEVISVAATDSKDRRASFSNYGKTVNISAPGVAIYSAIPGDKYASFSGTSMACPHIAGVAGMMLSENPKLDNKSVEAIIVESGDEVSDSKIPSRINLLKAVENARKK